MKSRFSLLLTAALFTSTTLLLAQDPTAPKSEVSGTTGTAKPDSARKAAADALLKAMKVDAMMASSFDQMAEMQKAMVAQQVKDPAEQAKTQKAVAAAMASTREELTWDKIGGMFAEIYASVFTAEEMKELTAFYESPIGKKFTDKQPELQAATMQKMQGFMMTLMPKMQAKIQAAMAEGGAEAPEGGAEKE